MSRSASFGGPQMCTNGDVSLGYGAPQFVGLGFSVMIFLIIVQAEAWRIRMNQLDIHLHIYLNNTTRRVIKYYVPDVPRHTKVNSGAFIYTYI